MAATALEVWALRNDRHDATLSFLTRRTFGTHTPVGRLVFSTSWIALAVWFPRHILTYELEKRDHS